MKRKPSSTPRWRAANAWAAAALAVALAVTWAALTPSGASAIGVTVPLGTADSFAVLGGQTVTNTGPSVLTGDLGVSPGSAITGFPPGVVSGATHSADAVAAQAQTDLTAAYNNAAGQAPDANIAGDLGGLTLTPGVYHATGPIGLTNTLTLDGQSDPNAVFIFQLDTTLTTASASHVVLTNGAQPCNVFWQVGSSATLGTGSQFVGNVLALTSITGTTGATVDGRLLARNGAVTLDTNTITRSVCGGATTGTTTTGETTTGTTTTGQTTTGTTGMTTTGETTTGETTTGTTGMTTNGGNTGGDNGGNTGGTNGGNTGGTNGGNTGGDNGGNTGGNNGGGNNGGVGSGRHHGRPHHVAPPLHQHDRGRNGRHNHPAGGAPTGLGGGTYGANPVETTAGAALLGLTALGAGVFTVRRRHPRSTRS